MATLQELMLRAQLLRQETAVDSISPERAGSIMYDTLAYINQMQLQGANPLLISKIYASVASMEADSAPVSDLTGQPLRPGQVVCIVTEDDTDSDYGTIYRYDGTTGGTSSWTAVGKIGITGYQYRGVAHPGDTPTGYAGLKCFWFAAEPGTYTNFGGLVVQPGNICALKYDGAWTKDYAFHQYAFTDNERANGAIKCLYFDKEHYVGAYAATGLYFDSFGYYGAGQIFFGNLKNSANQVLYTISFPYADRDKNTKIEATIGGAYFYLECDWSQFSEYPIYPRQINFNLRDVCFVDHRINTARVANSAITNDKIADNTIGVKKIANNEQSAIEDITATATKVAGYLFMYPSGPYASDMWSYYELPASAGDMFKVSAYAGQSARLWNFVSSGGNILAASADDSAVYLKSEFATAPAGTAKLIVNCRNDGAIKVERAVWGIDVGVISKNNAPLIKTITSPNILYGKTLVCCGDSITYGADMDAAGIEAVPGVEIYNRNSQTTFSRTRINALKTYGYQIAERNAMKFYNDGISGSTIEDLEGHFGFSLSGGRYQNLPDDIDYLTIFFGWNDNAYGTLGTIDDTENTTFYGAYNVVMPYLIDKYPYAKIALIVPFGTTVQMRQAVRLLANKWGVACFDMYQGGTPLYYGKEPSIGVDASVVASNQAKFQANGAHPNFAGHRQIADMLEHFLRGI